MHQMGKKQLIMLKYSVSGYLITIIYQQYCQYHRFAYMNTRNVVLVSLQKVAFNEANNLTSVNPDLLGNGIRDGVKKNIFLTLTLTHGDSLRQLF